MQKRLVYCLFTAVPIVQIGSCLTGWIFGRLAVLLFYISHQEIQHEKIYYENLTFDCLFVCKIKTIYPNKSVNDLIDTLNKWLIFISLLTWKQMWENSHKDMFQWIEMKVFSTFLQLQFDSTERNIQLLLYCHFCRDKLRVKECKFEREIERVCVCVCVCVCVIRYNSMGE